MKEKASTSHPLKVVLGCLCGLVIKGCASIGPGLETPITLAQTEVTSPVWAEAPLGLPDEPELDPQILAPTIVRGTDQMFNPPRIRRDFVVRGQAVSLRFEQAPVTDVVHAVLGDILGLPYVINQPVSGSLTIHTNVPLPREQVLPVLEAVLQANGLTMVVDQSGVYHVGRPEALRGVSPSLGDLDGLLPSGQNLLIVPLQYVGAAEMADILQPLATPETFVRIDGVRNLLILAGTRSRLQGLMEIVNTFDVDMLKGMSFGLFPLQHVSVAEVDAALKALGGAAVAAPTAPRGEGAGAAPQASQLAMPGPLAGVVRVVAIERLNALLVVTSRAYYLDQARQWIEMLDQPHGEVNEPQLFVYPVQNGTATHLSNLLTSLFGDGERGAPRVPADVGVAPGLSPAAIGLEGGNGALPAAAAPALTQVRIGADIRVVADEFNNALLIYAPRSEYRKIESALRRLDIAPTQVLIEATILEVTLTDEFEFGLQWFFKGGLGGGLDGAGRLTASTGPIATSQPGFSYTVSRGAEVRLVLDALARKSLLNVISSPSVLVLDNHTAHIQVGDQQPVRTARTVSETAGVTETIQFKDTGVLLNVTPSVNAGGLVTMTVNQRVTDVGPIDAATSQRSFLQREILSRVAVRSGETVVLGGLIRDNSTTGKTGVPVLHDIPVLGHLFGQTRRGNNRTELIVLITPRVLQNDSEVRAVSEEMRRRLGAAFRTLPGWTTEGPYVPAAPLPVR